MDQETKTKEDKKLFACRKCHLVREYCLFLIFQKWINDRYFCINCQTEKDYGDLTDHFEGVLAILDPQMSMLPQLIPCDIKPGLYALKIYGQDGQQREEDDYE